MHVSDQQVQCVEIKQAFQQPYTGAGLCTRLPILKIAGRLPQSQASQHFQHSYIACVRWRMSCQCYCQVQASALT